MLYLDFGIMKKKLKNYRKIHTFSVIFNKKTYASSLYCKTCCIFACIVETTGGLQIGLSHWWCVEVKWHVWGDLEMYTYIIVNARQWTKSYINSAKKNICPLFTLHVLVDGQHLKKADFEYPFEHDEVINYTLDGVSIHPVTTKIQMSFLSQLPERKEFDFKTITHFNGCDRRKLRMDQQHCSYSTILA